MQKVLGNETYTGTLIWGRSAKDGAPPVRVDGAFPALVTKRDFRQVAEMLQSRAPNRIHPRRATSPYLLSGLAKCEPCRKALTGAEAKSGKYTYYVCQSLLKRGRGSCNTPRLNAKHFEGLIVGSIRDNILTETNIGDLVRIANEEMDGVAQDQRKALRTIRRQLGDVKRRLARIWEVIETSKIDLDDAAERLGELRGRRKKLEAAEEEARNNLKQRRETLDKMKTVPAFAKEMREYLKTSELTETRSFIRSFVKEVKVRRGGATIRYSMPTPQDSPIEGDDTVFLFLGDEVRSIEPYGGAYGVRTRDLRLERAVS